ncbi:alkaline phosphatase family protein [Sphingobacterium composti Ten et al. 2007 non Yoo et al. 2007]|uniref:alkaline phosphatase family protein n=1 Tax=Sphingobacterium composti TaxID=363260 RepID=UPI001359100F|nr:alkaline phosphatase family protein [Sphingobacterium composti Ten et al. 2007 non Yoo et al. 2007]
MKQLIIKNRVCSILFLITVFLLTSCTKFPNPPAQNEEYTEIVDTTVKRKVLVIAVDGLVGSQIKAYKPANIAKLMEHAKYSYETKSDDNTNPYASWATLATGYKSYNHKITQESFQVDIGTGKEHADYELTPSIMHRLERADSKLRTASVIRNTTMNAKLFADADTNRLANSDAQAEQLLLNIVKQEKIDFIFGQFSGLVAAGQNGGFVVSNNNYKSSLDQIDKYIGNVVSAVESRETYAKEKWLIIICSPHGGTSSGKFGGTTLDEINTFSLYYNRSFLPLELQSESMSYMHANGYFPGVYHPIDDVNNERTRLFSRIGVHAQSPSGVASNIFNASMNSSKSVSYEFKISLQNEGVWNNGSSYKKASLLGKDLDDRVETKGWFLYGGQNGDDFKLVFQNGTKQDSVEFNKANKGNDWRHFVFTFKQLSSNSTSVEVIENGLSLAIQTINMGLAEFENQDPLTIGFTPISQLYAIPNFYISNFRVWNKALSLEEMKNIGCKNTIENNDPLFGNLVAYYRYFTEDKKWLNSINNNAPDLIVSGDATSRITQFYTFCDLPVGSTYLQTVDVIPQIYYWFDMELPGDNKLEGKEFLNRFLEEFYKD